MGHAWGAPFPSGSPSRPGGGADHRESERRLRRRRRRVGSSRRHGRRLDVASDYLFVHEETSYDDTGRVCSSDAGSDVVGTNNLTFVRFSSAGAAHPRLVEQTNVVSLPP